MSLDTSRDRGLYTCATITSSSTPCEAFQHRLSPSCTPPTLSSDVGRTIPALHFILELTATHRSSRSESNYFAPTFVDWYRDPDSNCGRSSAIWARETVAIAFVVYKLNQRSDRQIPASKGCYYYCQDDQSALAGCSRIVSLLAVLHQLPGLKKIFHEQYKQNQAFLHPPGLESRREQASSYTSLLYCRPNSSVGRP
jgi:hypothetical protein